MSTSRISSGRAVPGGSWAGSSACPQEQFNWRNYGGVYRPLDLVDIAGINSKVPKRENQTDRKFHKPSRVNFAMDRSV